MVAPTCFGITLPSSGNVPSAFWEMLNWEAVDTILWISMLCLVMWCVVISNRMTITAQYSNNPHTTDDWKMAIAEYIRNVDCAILNTVFLRTQFSVSINVRRLAGDILNSTCNFLYCNHQVHREFLITLYLCHCFLIMHFLWKTKCKTLMYPPSLPSLCHANFLHELGYLKTKVKSITN
jgi:hypothetical protein